MRVLLIALLAAISYAQTDMPDIVLIGDSLLDNKCDIPSIQFLGYAQDAEGNNVEDAPLITCDDPGAVNPSMEQALIDAGFNVKSFANYGWTLRAIEDMEYPELVEYAEERNNDIIIIFSGGGNDVFDAEGYTDLWDIRSSVQAFGDKLLEHSSLVINITPPFDISSISDSTIANWFLGSVDTSIADWLLGYDEEIIIKFSEFCEPGPDGIHPDNDCAQQMHDKIIDVLNRHQCSGGSCECKDQYHGYRCEEDCWTTDTWCWNCENCCDGSYQKWWGGNYCSVELEEETALNSMSALNGTQFLGALAIFGLVSVSYWIVQYFCHQDKFMKIQDAEIEI